MMLLLAGGWGLALAGALALAVSLAGVWARGAQAAGLLHRAALLALGLGVLLAAASPPVAWTRDGPALGLASLLPLAGLIFHPVRRGRAGPLLDLILAWLAAGAGVWGIIGLL